MFLTNSEGFQFKNNACLLFRIEVALPTFQYPNSCKVGSKSFNPQSLIHYLHNGRADIEGAEFVVVAGGIHAVG